MEIAIYLAGKIQKAHENPNESYWGEEEREQLRKAMAPWKAILLDPAIRSDDLSDQKSVFGRDMLMVYRADVVFVDARSRRGLGVGAEMMWAKLNNTPVVTLAPRDTHYVKSQTSLLGVDVEEWVHPFIENLSDCIVDSVEEGAEWISEGCQNIKGIEWVHEAMEYYLETQNEAIELRD